MLTTAQSKNQQIQDAIDKEIAKLLAMQLLDLVLALIPWFVWGVWSWRTDQVDSAKLDTLTLAQIKQWSQATSDKFYTEGGEP